MKNLFCTLGLLITLASTANSQSLTFDIAKFNPPKGWPKEDKGNYLTFTTTNNSKGTYCVLGIYKSISGSGNNEKDFLADWENIVAQKLGITQQPQKLKGEKKSGYEVMTGAGTFTQGQGTGLAFLTTLSSPSRMMSIVMLTNDTLYFSEYRSFFASLSLEDSSPSLSSNNSSGFGDYIFTAPPGWKTENSGNAVYLKGPDNSSTITILPMMPSSGSLESDLESIFWQVFPGWQADPRNIDHHIFTKGVSTSGWEYYQKEIGICKSDNRDIEIYAFIMLARINDKDAVIAGSYARGGDLLDEVYKPDWVVFFQSLDFRNFTKTSAFDLSKEIQGSWSGGGSSAVSNYNFGSNGKYSSGSAYSSSQRITDYTVKETITSFGTEGDYKVSGNVLTMTNSKTKIVRTPKIRIFYRNDWGNWYKYLGMLDISSYDGAAYEVNLRREEK